MIEIPDFRETVLRVGMTEATKVLVYQQMPHEELMFVMTSLWLNEWMLRWTVITERGEVKRGALQKKTTINKQARSNNTLQRWFE